MQVISGRDWANFAADNYSVWEQIVGAKVSHPEHGEGEIIKVENPIGLPLMSISFPARMEKISATFFRSGKLYITLNNLLDHRVKEWLSCRRKEELENERLSSKWREDHRLLIEEYGVPKDFLYGDNMLRLSRILDKLEKGENLGASELIWVESWKLHGILARNSIMLFEKNGEYGELARACRHFREAKLPDQVIARTTDLFSDKIANKKDRAMLLTTRAAAFRDKSDLNQAKELALEASQVFENFHTYNLLGAISWDKGERIKSEYYREMAKRLGSPPQEDPDRFSDFC